MWKDILLLYLVGENVHAQIQDVKSECYSPEVRNGSLANITCIFNYDIDVIKKKIYVDHIPPDRPATASPETVLQCQWSGGNFTCNPKSGYKWIGYVDNRLTFEIPVTLQTHGGQYWCDFLPSQPLNIKRCELHVTGLNFYPVKDFSESNSPTITTVNNTLRSKEAVTTTCFSQPVEYGSKAFVNCCFSVDIRVLKKTKIYVDHLPLNRSVTPETVVMCQLINENMLCNSSAGYQLHGNVTKELIIQITAAHTQHAGQYWCDVFASNPAIINECSLSVTDGQSSPRTTVNENNDTTDNVTESVPKDAVNIMAIAVPIAVTTIIIPSLILFICRKRSCRRCSRRSNSEGQQLASNTAKNSPESIPLKDRNGKTMANGDECHQLTYEDPQNLIQDTGAETAI